MDYQLLMLILGNQKLQQFHGNQAGDTAVWRQLAKSNLLIKNQ